MTNRIKLWVAAGTAACGVVLAGVGTVRPPTAEAQPPAAARTPLPAVAPEPPRPADPFAAPAGRATWEYAHADLPPSPAEFEDLLALRSRDRWEYAGVVDAALFTRNRPDKARIVFKRPLAQAAATAPRVAVPAVPAPPTPPALPGANADDTTVRLAEIALRRAEVQLAAAKAMFDLVTPAGRENLVPKKEQDELRLKVETAELDVAEAKVRLDAARKAAGPQTVPPPAGP